MLILPSQLWRAWLLSFWLVISVMSGLVFGILAGLCIAPLWSVVGVLATCILAVPGLVWPQVVMLPYRLWNRLARDFVRCARMILTAICFCIIIVVGRLGSSMLVSRPSAGQSLWIPRGTLLPMAYASQHASATVQPPRQSWIAQFLTWTVRSGNLWACCLLPFLLLLTVLEPEYEPHMLTDIYTLF
jgi:hypothetical protein